MVVPRKPADEGRPAPQIVLLPQARLLVVLQTDEVHRRVSELLAGLRLAREMQAGKER